MVNLMSNMLGQCSYQAPIFWGGQVVHQGELLCLAAVTQPLWEASLIPLVHIPLRQAQEQQYGGSQVGKEVHRLDPQTPSAHHLVGTSLT